MGDFHNKRAAALLHSNLYMVMGTASGNGKPWASPVFYTAGDDLVLYWCSDKNAQHSKNIRENSAVLLVIYNSAAPEGKFVGEGLYLEAQATELNNEAEVQTARAILHRRLGVPVDNHTYKKFYGVASRRIYKAIPKSAWVNDIEKFENGDFRDIRIEVPLRALLAQ